MSSQVEGTHRHRTDGEVYTYRVSYTVYPDESNRGAIAVLGFVRRAGKEWAVSMRLADAGADAVARAPTIVCNAMDAHIDGIDFNDA